MVLNIPNNDKRKLNVKLELEYTTCCSDLAVEKKIKSIFEDPEFSDGNIKVKKIVISS